MKRRRLLSTLGFGAVGLSGMGGVLGRDGEPNAQQATQATTQATTSSVPTTHADAVIDHVPGRIHMAFNEIYDSYANSSPRGPTYDRWDITAQALDQEVNPSPGHGRALTHEGNGKMVARIPRDGEISNKQQVAEIAAHSAGLMAHEEKIYRELDVYLLLVEEDAVNDGDSQPQTKVNQHYHIEGSWIAAFVNEQWNAETLLTEIFLTAETRNETPTPTPRPTTTATTEPTPTPEYDNGWDPFDYEMAGTDGTLELIEEGLTDSTLSGSYDRYATYLFGVVENVSGETLSYAEVRANFYVNGAVMAQGLANMRYLAAGDRWRFKAMASDPVQFDHVKLYFSGRV